MVVAVSGGADSVALLRILLETRQLKETDKAQLVVGHVNHGVRGPESDEDEQFVRHLADSLKVEFRCECIRPVVENNISEDSLREFRYRSLIRIAKQVDARYIVTGHTSDDQIETILFRIFRGTGISGLSGIPRIRVLDASISIVRPLLQLTRDEIVAYLKSIDQSYRTDTSNSDSGYSRNFIRNEILPLIRQRFGPTVDKSILRLSEQSNELQQFLNQASASLDCSILKKTPQQLELSTSRLKHQSPVLIRHFIIKCWDELNWPRQEMTHQWWAEISSSILSNESVKIVLNLPAEIRFSCAENIAKFTRAIDSNQDQID